MLKGWQQSENKLSTNVHNLPKGRLHAAAALCMVCQRVCLLHLATVIACRHAQDMRKKAGKDSSVKNPCTAAWAPPGLRAWPRQERSRRSHAHHAPVPCWHSVGSVCAACRNACSAPKLLVRAATRHAWWPASACLLHSHCP